jgi:hypothetical protein
LEGADARGALSPLLGTMPLLLKPDGDTLKLESWWQKASDTKAVSMAAQLDREGFDKAQLSRERIGKTPQSIALRHYEPEREYQIGVQRSSRADAGRAAIQIDLAAALDANSARRLADLQLLQIQRGQLRWTGHSVIGPQSLTVGDWITLNGSDDLWQIVELEIIGLVSKITARHAITADPNIFAASEAGRSLSSPDVNIGKTLIVTMDLPALSPVDPGRTQIVIAAAGEANGWRSAALSLNQDGNLVSIGTTAPAANIGTAENSLPMHSPWLFDDASELIVKLLHDGMELPAGSGSPSSQSAPYIWLNGEILRYGSALYLGNSRYRIWNLVRGCFGTETKIAGHQIGDNFVLLEPESLLILDDLNLITGTTLEFEALGVADEVPINYEILIEGLAVKPLAPVHGSAEYTQSGAINLSWKRRARLDFGWQNMVEQPLSEDVELYNVRIFTGQIALATYDSSSSNLSIPMATWTAWNLPAGAPVMFEIRQVGKFAQSDPLQVAATIPA